MAINKKLICFASKAQFTGANGINGATTPTDGYYGNIPESSIVFIQDTQEIWTHGTYFGLNAYLTKLNLESGILYTVYNSEKGTRSTKSGTYNLWGNTFDGLDETIDDSIKIIDSLSHVTLADNKTSAAWIVGHNASNNLIITYTSSATSDKGVDTSIINGAIAGSTKLTIDNSGQVTVNNGGLLISGTSTMGSVANGGIYVNSGYIIANGNYIRGKYIYNSSAVFDASTGDGMNWSALKKYSYNSFTKAHDLISTYNSNYNLAYIVQNTLAPSTYLLPWITGSNSDYSAWSIGIGGTNLYITRVAETQTENSPSQQWTFKANGDLVGSAGYIESATGFKVTGKTSTNIGFLKSDGTVSNFSDTTFGDYMTKSSDIEIKPIHVYIGNTWLNPGQTDSINNAAWLLSGTSGQLYFFGEGSYLIQISHTANNDDDGGIYTGYFSYTTGSGTDEEIALHRAGNSSSIRLFAKIKYITTSDSSTTGVYLLISALAVESDCTGLTIKIKKLL